jgi:hypothetical protein
MRWFMCLAALLFGSVLVVSSSGGPAPAAAPPAQGGMTVSQPYTSGNLAVYFVTSPRRADAAAYTLLPDALKQGWITVHETGNVNELAVENTSDRDVFIHQGDVVKGGKQDRVMGTDLVVQARSGRMIIPAFCVESGRWQKRGDEDVAKFASAEENASHPALRQRANANSSRGDQSGVWDGVAKAQKELASKAGSDVKPAGSPSSYQLTVENEKVAKLRESYIRDLESAFDKHPDATGVIFAVDGQFIAADLYASPELARSMYGRLLRGIAIRAVATDADNKPLAPSPEHARAFLDSAADGSPQLKQLTPRTKILMREGRSAMQMETYDDGRDGIRVHLALTASEPPRPNSDKPRGRGEQQEQQEQSDPMPRR